MTEFKFLFRLNVSEHILHITDNLSKALQSVSMSAADAQAVAVKTVETLKKKKAMKCLLCFGNMLSLCVHKGASTTT